jgi:lysophospholipase L1-like esterase
MSTSSHAPILEYDRAAYSRVPAVAYLGHLVLPALLLADVVRAWLLQLIPFHLRSLDTAVAAVAALWLFAGLGLWLRYRRRAGFSRKIIAPLLSIYTAYASLILLEILLRLFTAAPTIPGDLFSWAVTPPGKHTFTVNPADYPGVSGMKTVTINALGIRGPMPPKRSAAYRILAVGASTTECSLLDDSEEWAHLLMERLNAAEKRRPVWVGNAGIDGMTTIQHLILLQWLPGAVDSDMVILLVGGTDLTTSLTYEGKPTEAILERAFGFQKNLPPGTRWRSRNPIYSRLRITLMIRDALRNLKGRLAWKPGASPERSDTAPQMMNSIATKERRASAPVVPLPDLTTALAEYRSRINALADRCAELGERCLFVTHPALWRADLSPADQRLLWFGWVGPWEHPKGYVSPGDLARALDAYNRTLLDVCSQRGLECYDLAREIPKDTSAFFDDVHFNEGGARLVAQSLARYLLSRPPFRINGPQASAHGHRP